jgi:DNA-binding PadR family transcriptional regulator
MKDVAQDSRGQVRMGNGTLYGWIKRMLADDLIEDAGDRSQDDSRGKYYKLTSRGRKVLQMEMQRYVDTVDVIRNSGISSRLLPGGLRA